MSEVTLSEVVRYAAEKFGIPGLSVGVWADGVETYAAHGVTNIQDPQPIDRNTLYAVGSTSKPFAATALMHLVAQGKVELARNEWQDVLRRDPKNERARIYMNMAQP